MKVNQKYLEIGLVVLIVIIGVCAYNFGYRPYSEKAASMQTEINQLNERKGVLEEKIAKTDEFNENIQNADDIIDVVLEKYGPGNTMEKSIMMIVDATNKCGINVSNISMTEPTDEFVSETVDEEGNPTVSINKCMLNLTYKTGYAANKNLVDYINNNPERMTIESMNLNFNQESGLLDGSLSINLYGVEDENHTYVAPIIEDVNIGSTNIFRSNEPVEEVLLDENGNPIEPVAEPEE